MKCALIVGCQGQDGSLLRDLLIGRDYAVTGLSRQSVHMPDGGQSPPVDVADPSAVAETIREARPDEIYYLAAFHHSSQQTAVNDTRATWAASMAVNASGPVNFLEAVRQHAPDARFFYAGSCLAYGTPGETPQTEETCFRPACVYGISKATGAHAVRHYREKHGLFAVTGILFNHESHLRPDHFLSRKIVRAAWRIMRGEKRELLLGDLSARADWGYAPDFVEAFWATLQAENPDDYVVATGKLHGVRDWVEKTFALAGLDWQNHVREEPGLAVRGRAPLVGDATRIRERCGWTPATDFDHMVELMFEHEGWH
ncbi:GDP-mannose 4,6-dehydratase [Fundidesulfovibrio putealis]|uniref:GDP-mannose 4,6-dehydratase n=1 Tax=Fundidesulfovibrio putealis TaxID=270496 RepID=UPI0005BBB52A|nr:GDP-mannose 4,6-dehydratase [Fundidesulfovibrio putealis]